MQTKQEHNYFAGKWYENWKEDVDLAVKKILLIFMMGVLNSIKVMNGRFGWEDSVACTSKSLLVNEKVVTCLGTRIFRIRWLQYVEAEESNLVDWEKENANKRMECGMGRLGLRSEEELRNLLPN